jgi:Leucine-rich repeat (LRR) protein
MDEQQKKFLDDAGVISSTRRDSVATSLAVDENTTEIRVIDARNFTDDKLKKVIAILPNLTSVDLTGTTITVDGLNALKELAKLKELKLQKFKITSDVLSALVDLTQLETLDLSWTNISDNDLTTLLPLKNLRKLKLNATDITAGSVPILMGFKNLIEMPFTGRFNLAIEAVLENFCNTNHRRIERQQNDVFSTADNNIRSEAVTATPSYGVDTAAAVPDGVIGVTVVSVHPPIPLENVKGSR